jgi:hypothetical protein
MFENGEAQVMMDKANESTLRSLIGQVNSFRTTRFSGFGYWHKDLDKELTREEGPLFQLYAGLGVLVRDLYLYLKEHDREDSEFFEKVVSPIVAEDRQKYPETTLFRIMDQGELPEGFSTAAVEGNPTVAGLDDWRIVHEWTTKPGKRAFYGFFRESREQLEELCGPDGPYEQFRRNEVDEGELGFRIASVFLKEVLSGDPLWFSLAAYMGVCAIRTELETMCERRTILFVAADPTDEARLRLGQELREIQEKLQLASMRDKFDLIERMSVRPADLSQALLDVEPQIVHFSGHARSTGALCLEDETGRSHPVKPDALAALFEQFAAKVGCVVLNACYTVPQANAIARHIDYVIGMEKAIGDKAAIAFAVGFYQALGAGRDVKQAYELGCVQIGLQNIPENLTPVLVEKESAHL